MAWQPMLVPTDVGGGGGGVLLLALLKYALDQVNSVGMQEGDPRKTLGDILQGAVPGKQASSKQFLKEGGSEQADKDFADLIVPGSAENKGDGAALLRSQTGRKSRKPHKADTGACRPLRIRGLLQVLHLNATCASSTATRIEPAFLAGRLAGVEHLNRAAYKEPTLEIQPKKGRRTKTRYPEPHEGETE